MITKSLLALSIVASTLIGATAPASAAVTLVGSKVVIDADTALPIQIDVPHPTGETSPFVHTGPSKWGCDCPPRLQSRRR